MVLRADQSEEGQRYTLAQFARRSGISEGRARALWNEGRLPDPDGLDVDGRPWWRDLTIDGWCRSTGRALPSDASWPHEWATLTEPAPVVFRGEVSLSRRGEPARVYVIVWDTPNGHVVHVSRYDDDHVDRPTAARAAAHVLEPVFWPSAVILVPDTIGFSKYSTTDPGLHAPDAFRLRPGNPRDDERPTGRANRLRDWITQTLGDPQMRDDEDPIATDPDRVPVEQIGFPFPRWIAPVLGRSLPLWVDGTCTPAAARRLSDDPTPATFTVDDTTTGWPQTRDRLVAAVAWGMNERFPLAFAALAEDALRVLEDVEQAHANFIDHNDGAFIVARPARPEWSIELEHLTRSTISNLNIETSDAPDPATIGDELRQLSDAEAAMPWDDAAGEALAEGLALLAANLRGPMPDAAAEIPTVYAIGKSGPAAKQYLAGCTLMDEGEQERLLRRPTRRVLRLLLPGFDDRDLIRQHDWLMPVVTRVLGLYWDPAGRLVAELRNERPSGDNWLHIEWPRTLPVGWTDTTVIAGDDGDGGVGLFALTPAADGEIRVDPVPNPGDDPSYKWGYTGTSPITTYEALTRCALGTWENMRKLHTRDDASDLWRVISTTDGPLRLPWPQVQAWARADRHRVAGKQ